MNYFIRHINKKTYSAILSTSRGEFFSSHYPFSSFSSIEKPNEELPRISKLLSKDLCKKELENKLIMLSLAELNDFFIKINNGSVNLNNHYEYKEKLLEKIKNNTFLLGREGKYTLINWLIISFKYIEFDKSEVDEIKEVIQGSSHNPRFVDGLYNKFGKEDKGDLIARIIDNHWDEIKSSEQWNTIRLAAFSIIFLCKCYAKNRADEATKEHGLAIEEFERATGVDANYNPRQRHTDRFSRNQHFNGKKNKMNRTTK